MATRKKAPAADTPVGQVEELPAPAQHKIYVAYLHGKKGKHGHKVIRAPFDDIETEDQLAAVLSVLQADHPAEEVTVVFIKSLEA